MCYLCVMHVDHTHTRAHQPDHTHIYPDKQTDGGTQTDTIQTRRNVITAIYCCWPQHTHIQWPVLPFAELFQVPEPGEVIQFGALK